MTDNETIDFAFTFEALDEAAKQGERAARFLILIAKRHPDGAASFAPLMKNIAACCLPPGHTAAQIRSLAAQALAQTALVMPDETSETEREAAHEFLRRFYEKLQ
jgi:hypothetical protein